MRKSLSLYHRARSSVVAESVPWLSHPVAVAVLPHRFPLLFANPYRADRQKRPPRPHAASHRAEPSGSGWPRPNQSSAIDCSWMLPNISRAIGFSLGASIVFTVYAVFLSLSRRLLLDRFHQ